MTQAQLVSALADQMGVDEKLAAAALESLADIVAIEVAAGGAVTLPGLGRFAARSKPARKVAKPGESVVTVTIAKELRDAARG